MKEFAQIPAQRVVGRVFTESSADENGSFESAWDEFNEAGHFKALDPLADVPNRTSVIVFSPYGSMQYWIGSVIPESANVPNGYQVLNLPAATGAVADKDVKGMMTGLPLATTYNEGLATLEKAGYQLPEHIGQTDTPYYLERYDLNNQGVAQRVEYTIYARPDQLEGFDDIE
ncbi:GyrI-like domain-containing protein [Lacticaseibacillus pantheris]|jgi:predicted transcriptional regulator YdeE|uniref:GyrI-like domain-containing protein n=1 Tax=Lacticaseibacillus pantheris TaxID=171523 RepID=UPI00265AF68D|nr:GyrI-like domain-containing protein [Lacticaseibacillus pantheris]WKF84742.1 GyrI-like domain-containing protein [Lacticaseibacillus pantheris]